ncbi:MAG: hypothetical protein K2F90_04780 [Clostridiales bacterium]|nr:hypothetical protein [Clostridiales bacterium]
MNNHTSKNRIGRRVLLLLATVITALAVAVTCALTLDTSKKVSVDRVDSTEASTSAFQNYTNISNVQTYINNGTFTNGNYIDFTFVNNSYRTITLPRGTWKFELWGARGGYSGSTSANTGTANGGYGGYVSAQIALTATSTTYYIYLGGTGAGGTGSIDRDTSWKYGGYNGGGNGIGSAGSGGGGATDVRTTAGTATTASSYNTRVLVAAGGGGGNTTTYTQVHSNGGIYKGANADSSRHSSSYPNDEGGGGGGYYGGAVRHGDDPRSSYSGSNYVGSGFTSLANNLGNSGASGNGRARITAVSINQAPVNQGYNFPTAKVRCGSGAGISIAASTLAKDNDYANISGGNINNVYFTAGTSSNYDTAPSDNNGLYLNSACTTNASSYLTYTWTGGSATARTTLNITAIKKLPRAGVDGQADGKFTLYTKVRDNFGTNTSRGVGVASFTVTVTNQNLTVKGASNVANKYKFGSSNYYTNQHRIDNNFAASYTDGKIFNPAGTGKTTIFIPKPISPTETAGITLNATEFFADADTAYDNVAFKSYSVVSAYASGSGISYVNASAYYTVTLNANSAYATGLYPSLTIKPTGTRPNGSPYVVLQLTAQSSEAASKAQVGNTVNTVYLVFQISNTRPYFGSTQALATKLTEPLVTVNPGATARLNLKNFVYDMDDGSNLRATFAQGANDLKVPTNEYIQVDTSNTVINLAANSQYYSNLTNSTYKGNNRPASNSNTTGEGSVATHFNKASVAANGSNAASTANVTYRYVDSQTIEFTGRAATQNQYRDTNGNRATRLGDFYVMVRVIDPSDPTDAGIWFPIAIKVNSNAPKEPSTFANVTLGFDNTGAGNYAILTPISYVNSAGVLQGIGKTSKDLDNNNHAIPFAQDADGFMYAQNSNGTNDSVQIERARALNDFAFIFGGDSAILDNDANGTGTFFSVQRVTLYAARSVFKMIPDSALGSYGITPNVDNQPNLCSFDGLRITALRSTNGEYFQFRVNVKDTHAASAVPISICVKVENRAVAHRQDPHPSEGVPAHKINAIEGDGKTTPFGAYTENASLGGAKVVNYTIEVNDEVQITPYDYAYDLDIDPGSDKINASEYNSNPLNAGFGTLASGTILKNYSIAHTTAPATNPATQKTKTNVQAQKLDFANRAAIEAYDAQYGNYVHISVEDYSIVKNANGTSTSYAIPAIKITGVSRTTSAIVQIHFSITDGVNTVDCSFTVTVLNAAPTLNPDLNDYYNLAAFAVVSGTTIVTPNVKDFTAAEISYDKDGDIPTFDSESVSIVAKDGNAYYSQLYYEDGKYHGYDPENPNGKTPTVNLAEYVGITVTKGAGGADVLRLTGLSSTELFNLPIYAEFTVRDGYRAQPKSATLHLLINVINTTPIFVGDGLLKTEASQQSPEKYQWLIGYEVSSEIAQRRYLFNSRELYDGSLKEANGTPISIQESNKVYLFDDYDAKQNVILNPYEMLPTGSDAEIRAYRDSLVSTFETRVYNADRSEIVDYTEVTATDFTQDAYKHAAVLYTPMYIDSAGDNAYINVRIRFFRKEGDRDFREVGENTDIKDCEYWAIEIQDTHEQGTRREIQFALSVKDSHHGKNLYVEPDKKVVNTNANVSERKLLNFFYNYRQPGILAMHTYYRTDGNAESKVLVQEAVDGKPARYLVDQSVITSDDFDASEKVVREGQTKSTAEIYTNSKDPVERQNILGTVKFRDDFKYKYFERTYETDENGATATYLTSKRYAVGQTQFYYSPIVVTTGIGTLNVPMSYIALPKGAGEDTDTGTHVTFANVGNSISGGNVLLDKDYASWNSTQLSNIYKNIKLSDGVNTYDIDNNPYITLRYIAKTDTNNLSFAADYTNTTRFHLTSAEGSPVPFENANYREDKYGFAITKKLGGRRATGMLKLTFALKTIDNQTEGKVEYVDVEVNLLDYAPRVTYWNYATNQGGEAGDGKYVEPRVMMTIGNTGSATDTTTNYVSTMSLVSRYEESDPPKSPATDRGNKGVILYNDPDFEDTMRFYLPSATGTMTREEIAHFLQSDGSTAIAQYYNTDTDHIKENGGEGYVDPYTYEPNPNFDLFFDVSPASGSTETLQFIPKAKTQPKLPTNGDIDEYCRKYNLIKETIDSQGNYRVYYPFRVLFYDEYRGSAFTDGFVFGATIRVYIDNDAIKANTTAMDKDNAGRFVYFNSSNTGLAAEFRNKNIHKYTINLSTSSTYYVDVTSLLNDDDIVLDGTSYATQQDEAWTKLTADEQCRKDYLVMPIRDGVTPAAVQYEDITRILYNTASHPVSEELPFDIYVGGTNYGTENNYSGLSRSTLIFKAKCAYNETRSLGLTFKDSNGTQVQLVFDCVYSNEVPTANAATFGATNVIDVSMKTGEKFYLYASDSKLFSQDAKSGFVSYKELVTDGRYTFPYASSGTQPAQQSAEEMASTFKFFTSTYGSEVHTGDSLILGTDDAPTTLRIIKAEIPNGVGTRLTANKELLVKTENYGNGRQDGWLRVAVSAAGVVNTQVTITLQDGKGKTVEVMVRVNVISTAPTAKTTGLPAGVTLENDGDYAISLAYGESKDIYLSQLMSDRDSGDVNSLSVYSDITGNMFSIANPDQEKAVVSAAETSDRSGSKQVTITATDFINKQGDNSATVSFRVKDAHGAVSDVVNIKVRIAPAEVTTVVAANSSLAINVMSYAQYIDSDVNKGEPQEVVIVENTGAKLFKDTDVTAPSAAYTVDVYVLLRETESGAMNTTTYSPGNSIALYSRNGANETFYNTTPEARYVRKFFDITASEDGKSLLFVPTAATLRSGTRVSSIPLYVIVKKLYDDGNTMAGKGSQIDVTVANSKLTATENSSLNNGYPLVKNTTDLRDSEFLSFTGSKGDSLTWKLYNLENMYQGLYYDYDMINMAGDSDGKEAIKYIDYSYTVANEMGNLATRDPVLSVECNGVGDKQELTITILRNVTTGQPPANGIPNKSTQIEVSIYAVDAVNNVAGVTKNDRDRVTVTKILVNVCNDKPEIAQTGKVSICPFCGKGDNVRQNTPRTALCSTCNKSFKSLDPEQLGYTLSLSQEAGYVMNVTLAQTDKPLNVSLADIIDDADIDMDAYVMLPTGGNTSLMGSDGSTLASIRAGDETAFRVSYPTGTNKYDVSTQTGITFTCVSTTRGAVAVCTVKFRDSYIGSETSVLTIRLTVGNIAPTLKQGVKTNLTVMGIGPTATEQELAAGIVVFNILDYITDANGDNFIPEIDENGECSRTPTYTYIDDITVYTTDDDVKANQPDIYGPSFMAESTDENDNTVLAPTTDTACMVNWVDGDAAHQKFLIQPLSGIYGTQKVTFRIMDKGYEHGLMANITDGLELRVTFTITIANPLDDVEEVLPSKPMVFGVTRTILAQDLLGEDNARGYDIADIQEMDGNSYLKIVKPEDDPSGNWRIYASVENINTRVKVTFTTGDVTRERILPINVVANNKPQLKNGNDTYRYTVSMLDTKEKGNLTIKIKPTDWFEDIDPEDVMTFISPVSSSQTVKVEAIRAFASSDEGGQPYILLKFLRRGQSVITVNLVDLSGRSYSYNIKVECTDAPELSWWDNFVSLIEANWLWFWIIVAAALLLIILLIVIIVVVVKKRKMRREIEALLESETELEQEMMRLSGGGMGYQSFGYLPPTPQGMVNPGMMLGGGATAPQQNSLQLNAGTGAPPPQQPTVNNIPTGAAPNARPQTPPSNDGFDPDNF